MNKSNHRGAIAIRINFGLGSKPSPLPLRITIAGEFAVPSDMANPTTVDKKSFRDVIGIHAGELLFEVTNHLASHPKVLRIELQITDLAVAVSVGLHGLAGYPARHKHPLPAIPEHRRPSQTPGTGRNG